MVVKHEVAGMFRMSLGCSCDLGSLHVWVKMSFIGRILGSIFRCLMLVDLESVLVLFFNFVLRY